MKIGVMADSHDNLPLIKKCIDFFRYEKIDLFIHAGDYIAPFALRDLKLLSCKKIGVFGNNDGEKAGLINLMTQVGGEIFEPPYRVQVAGYHLVITHDIALVDNVFINGTNPDILIYAHTHKPRVEKEQNVLKINPGESSGWLSGKATVALIDLVPLKIRIEEIA